MQMRTMMVTVMAVALAAATIRAHDDEHEDDMASLRFDATLVSDADPGDLVLGSAGAAFVKIAGEAGGSVKLHLAGVLDAAGGRVSVVGCELLVSTVVDGAPVNTAMPFELANGQATVHGRLGLSAGNRLEIAAVAVSCPPAGVFAVPGLGPSAGDDDEDDDHADDDGDDEDGDDLVVAADRRGAHDRDRRRGGERRDGHGKFKTALIGDADAGDFSIDSAAGSFVHISGHDRGKVKMHLRGVTDAAGTPVDHVGNRLVVSGLRNGAPVTASFPFELAAGEGKVRGSLGLPGGDVLEIQAIVVDDGATVFAVPGLFVRDDGDDDGVDDPDDACSESASEAVGADGCGIAEKCGCDEGRAALRACVRKASREIKRQMRSACGGGKRCRQMVRRLNADRRALLRSCRD